MSGEQELQHKHLGMVPQLRANSNVRFLLSTGVLLFLAIFLPVIRLQDGSFDTQALFFVLISLLFLMRGAISTLLTYPCGALSLLLVTIIIYGLSVSLLSADSPSVHVALRPFRSLITLLGSVALVHLIYGSREKAQYSSFYLAAPMMLAVGLHGVIMLTQFFLPEFRDFIYQYTVDPQVMNGARYFYSMSGLTNGGGSQLSIYQSLGVLLLPIILSGGALSLRARFFLGSLTLICLASVAITGRSGLLCVAIFYPITCVMVQGFSKGVRQCLAHAVVTTALTGAIIVAADGYSTNEEANFRERGIVDGIVAVTSRANDEITEQTTIKILQEHFVVPESTFVFVFGDPLHAELSQNSEDRQLKSDIGYVRLLFSYGIIGLLLHCVFYGIVITFGWGFLSSKREMLKGLGVFCIVTSLVIFVFNAKEILFLSRMGLSVTCLSVAALALFRDIELRESSFAQGRGIRAGRIPNPALANAENEVG